MQAPPADLEIGAPACALACALACTHRTALLHSGRDEKWSQGHRASCKFYVSG